MLPPGLNSGTEVSAMTENGKAKFGPQKAPRKKNRGSQITRHPLKNRHKKSQLEVKSRKRSNEVHQYHGNGKERDGYKQTSLSEEDANVENSNLANFRTGKMASRASNERKETYARKSSDSTEGREDSSFRKDRESKPRRRSIQKRQISNRKGRNIEYISIQPYSYTPQELVISVGTVVRWTFKSESPPFGAGEDPACDSEVEEAFDLEDRRGPAKRGGDNEKITGARRGTYDFGRLLNIQQRQKDEPEIELVAPGTAAHLTWTFTEEGTFPFYNPVYPFMKGRIRVVKYSTAKCPSGSVSADLLGGKSEQRSGSHQSICNEFASEEGRRAEAPATRGGKSKELADFESASLQTWRKEKCEEGANLQKEERRECSRSSIEEVRTPQVTTVVLTEACRTARGNEGSEKGGGQAGLACAAEDGRDDDDEGSDDQEWQYMQELRQKMKRHSGKTFSNSFLQSTGKGPNCTGACSASDSYASDAFSGRQNSASGFRQRTASTVDKSETGDPSPSGLASSSELDMTASLPGSSKSKKKKKKKKFDKLKQNPEKVQVPGSDPGVSEWVEHLSAPHSRKTRLKSQKQTRKAVGRNGKFVKDELNKLSRPQKRRNIETVDSRGQSANEHAPSEVPLPSPANFDTYPGSETNIPEIFDVSVPETTNKMSSRDTASERISDTARSSCAEPCTRDQIGDNEKAAFQYEETKKSISPPRIVKGDSPPDSTSKNAAKGKFKRTSTKNLAQNERGQVREAKAKGSLSDEASSTDSSTSSAAVESKEIAAIETELRDQLLDARTSEDCRSEGVEILNPIGVSRRPLRVGRAEEWSAADPSAVKPGRITRVSDDSTTTSRIRQRGPSYAVAAKSFSSSTHSRLSSSEGSATLPPKVAVSRQSRRSLHSGQRDGLTMTWQRKKPVETATAPPCAPHNVESVSPDSADPKGGSHGSPAPTDDDARLNLRVESIVTKVPKLDTRNGGGVQKEMSKPMDAEACEEAKDGVVRLASHQPTGKRLVGKELRVERHQDREADAAAAGERHERPNAGVARWRFSKSEEITSGRARVGTTSIPPGRTSSVEAGDDVHGDRSGEKCSHVGPCRTRTCDRVQVPTCHRGMGRVLAMLLKQFPTLAIEKEQDGGGSRGCASAFGLNVSPPSSNASGEKHQGTVTSMEVLETSDLHHNTVIPGEMVRERSTGGGATGGVVDVGNELSSAVSAQQDGPTNISETLGPVSTDHSGTKDLQTKAEGRRSRMTSRDRQSGGDGDGAQKKAKDGLEVDLGSHSESVPTQNTAYPENLNELGESELTTTHSSYDKISREKRSTRSCARVGGSLDSRKGSGTWRSHPEEAIESVVKSNGASSNQLGDDDDNARKKPSGSKKPSLRGTTEAEDGEWRKGMGNDRPRSRRRSRTKRLGRDRGSGADSAKGRKSRTETQSTHPQRSQGRQVSRMSSASDRDGDRVVEMAPGRVGVDRKCPITGSSDIPRNPNNVHANENTVESGGTSRDSLSRRNQKLSASGKSLGNTPKFAKTHKSVRFSGKGNRNATTGERPRHPNASQERSARAA